MFVNELDKEHKEMKAIQDIPSLFGLDNQIDSIAIQKKKKN